MSSKAGPPARRQPGAPQLAPGSIGRSLDALADAVGPRTAASPGQETIRALLARELARGQGDEWFPLAPARIVADTRAALRRDDIVLVDTGALKMWMARLYPAYEPDTCLISNGLSTMAWTVPARSGRRSPGRTPGSSSRPAMARS